MGNQMSVPQRAEKQENDSETDAHEVASKRDCVHNGMPVMVSAHTVQLYDEGRAGDPVEDSSEPPGAPGRPNVSSTGALGDKGMSDSMALWLAAARGPSPDKTPGRTPADHHCLAATQGPALLPPESQGAAPSKPKDAGFLKKVFKLDKGQDKAPAVSHQAECVVPNDQVFNIPGFPGQVQDVLEERDIVEGKDKGQEVTHVSCPLPRDPEELEIAKEDLQTTTVTEENNFIMSFFKTLVSPNKAETKKDLEDMGAEKSPAMSAGLKSDKATFVPQETQGAAKNPTPIEMAKEDAKQKWEGSSLPLGKLFWKKSVKGDGGITHSEEINGKDSSYQTWHTPQKATTPPKPDPAGASQKGKEGSAKDKTAADSSKQRNNKQEAKEPAPCTCSQRMAVDQANVLQHGDRPQKRPEKRRQSLGGFFKGLGPKRMLDAQVQTDPVSIGPVVKSK